MKIFKVFLVMIFAFFIGCSTPTPQEAAIKFSEDMFAGKLDNMLKQMYFGEKKLSDEEKTAINAKIAPAALKGKQTADKNGGVKKIVVDENNSKIENDMARIRINVIFNNDTKDSTNVSLKKVKDEWKVLFK